MTETPGDGSERGKADSGGHDDGGVGDMSNQGQPTLQDISDSRTPSEVGPSEPQRDDADEQSRSSGQ